MHRPDPVNDPKLNYFGAFADHSLPSRSDLSKVRCSASLPRRRTKINEKGETRLHIAARLNKQNDVIRLIADGADINAQDYAGQHLIQVSTSLQT